MGPGLLWRLPGGAGGAGPADQIRPPNNPALGWEPRWLSRSPALAAALESELERKRRASGNLGDGLGWRGVWGPGLCGEPPRSLAVPAGGPARPHVLRVAACPPGPHADARTHSRHRGATEGRAASRRGGGAAPLFASGGGKLSQRHDHERQHHAGGQQGGDDDGCDGAGPQRACGGRRAGQPRGPGPARAPPHTHRPSTRRTATLVQTLPRGAVLRARRGGRGWGPGGLGLPGGAGALRGAFSRRQLDGLVPQGGRGLLRTLGCKAKDRGWGAGGRADGDVAPRG